MCERKKTADSNESRAGDKKPGKGGNNGNSTRSSGGGTSTNDGGNSTDGTTDAACSFCHSHIDDVERLIAGPDRVFICNQCVQMCYASLGALNEQLARDSDDALTNIHLLKPTVIKEFLDQYVVGQEKAKRVLSVAICNHYKRVLHNKAIAVLLGRETDGVTNNGESADNASSSADGSLSNAKGFDAKQVVHELNHTHESSEEAVEIQKSNILMIGPTGCGKTLMVETLARMLNVPLVIVDATTLTETGYVGEDVEGMIAALLQQAKSIKRAEVGIVYIDECDKIARKSSGQMTNSRDISGQGVQEALLRMIQGAKISVPIHGNRRSPHQETVVVDTTDILFIFGGAFDGLQKIIEARESGYGVGFESRLKLPDNRQSAEILARVDVDDLIKYGFIPEFIGRIPIITVFDELDENALKEILTRPKNAIVKQYKKLFKIDNVDLEISEEAIAAIAKKSIEKKTGARGLRSILESVLIDTMFDTIDDPSVSKVALSAATITEGLRPEVFHTDVEVKNGGKKGSKGKQHGSKMRKIAS